MPQHFCKVLGLLLPMRSPVGPLLEVWRMRDLPDPGTVSVHRVQILLSQVLNVATEQDPGSIRRPSGSERYVATPVVCDLPQAMAIRMDDEDAPLEPAGRDGIGSEDDQLPIRRPSRVGSIEIPRRELARARAVDIHHEQ